MLDPAREDVALHRAELVRFAVDDERLHARAGRSPSCSCSWLCSGTVEPGSNSIRLSIAPSPKSGRPETPAASSNDLTSSKWTNCGSTWRLYNPRCMTHHREEFRVEGMAEPISHYTDAVKAGGLLFVSGIVPIDADGKLVGEGDVAEQARQVFRNMELCLERRRLRLRRRGQGRALPARRRRPRRRSTRCGWSSSARRGPASHARRGLGAGRPRRAARDRGGRRYPGAEQRPSRNRRSASLGSSSSARS